ncbi:hypothetical protein BK809_0000213 [Diplodia seriata]|uniref:NB-ARC domain-containing protein n=1 Tax=Diplodia seriata TaxID=420778 RepID=A0A1S8BAY1_9PEZI|nr:hypothetical protein BK809_0000213 [Diplodia seriata]
MAGQDPSSPLRLSYDSDPKDPYSQGFIGRLYERNIIGQALQSPRQHPGQKRFVITGKSGQGKTALCVQVVEDVRRSFAAVFWIDVSTPEAARKGFAAVLDSPRATINDIRPALQSLESSNDTWLLILDNANDPDVTYTEYFPQCQHGSIIIISRETSVNRHATMEPLVLRGMSPADSVLLLQRTIDWSVPPESEEAHAAEEAALLLENHALSLILANAFITKRRCSFASYVKKYEAEKTSVRSRQANPSSTLTSAYAACSLSAKTLLASGAAGEAALALLSHLSLLPHNPVPIDAARSAWTSLHSSPPYTATPHLDTNAAFTAAIALLSSLALIAPSRRSLTTHPIIRAWAQDRHYPACRRCCSPDDDAPGRHLYPPPHYHQHLPVPATTASSAPSTPFSSSSRSREGSPLRRSSSAAAYGKASEERECGGGCGCGCVDGGAAGGGGPGGRGGGRGRRGVSPGGGEYGYVPTPAVRGVREGGMDVDMDGDGDYSDDDDDGESGVAFGGMEGRGGWEGGSRCMQVWHGSRSTSREGRWSGTDEGDGEAGDGKKRRRRRRKRRHGESREESRGREEVRRGSSFSFVFSITR